VKNDGAAARLSDPAVSRTLPGSPASATADNTFDDGREDLTVFFTIGVILDVLLVAAFLLWAAGQWRKTKK
jgi:hypothetical protein